MCSTRGGDTERVTQVNTFPDTHRDSNIMGCYHILHSVSLIRIYVMNKHVDLLLKRTEIFITKVKLIASPHRSFVLCVGIESK